ncbi:MAG: hypothetical protein R3F48_15270 [Candidatus Zixiibacteriota bacterium]
MRVSKLLWVLSLAVLVLTFFITTPGTVQGADPWDELNASNNDGSSDGSDGGGSQGTGSVENPDDTGDADDTTDLLMMGTPGFWWELLFGDDESGVNVSETTTTDVLSTEGATTAITLRK